MANPLFGVVAACRLDITAGSSSRAAYFALVVQYQFGTPIIYGRAPAELATSIGVPLYSQVGDPGIQATVPGVVVVSFPNPTPSVVVGGVAYPVSTAVAGGTLVGVNYVDPNGVLHPDVDWQWQISVEPYQQGVSSGSWNQQVISYTGDGTAGRLIPTTFPLNVGRVAIWIFSQSVFEISGFRHNGMPGTSFAAQPVSTTSGIMAFQANGFTITNGGVLVNTNTVKYTAVVLSDTTTDNRYMTVGDYTTWNASLNVINNFNFGSNIVLGESGGLTNVTLENLLQPVLTGTGASVVATIIDDHHWTYSGVGPIPAPTPASPSVNETVVANNPASRPIAVPGMTRQITQLWLFNRPRRAPFCLSEMPAGQSGVLGFTSVANNNNIKSLGVGHFDIGTDDASSGSNQGHYYYVAFSIPVGDPVRAVFNTYSVVGNGGSVAVNVGFLPAFVGGRGLVPGVDNSIWRGPWHTGTQSTQFDQTALATDGITALTASGCTLGTIAAPNGVAAYGFALAATGTVVAAGVFAPTTPPPYNPGGPGVPLPTPTPAVGGAGCSTDVAPGTAGGAGCGTDLSPVAATDAGTTGCAR